MTRIVVAAGLLALAGIGSLALAPDSLGAAAEPTPLVGIYVQRQAPPSGPIGGVSFEEDSDGAFEFGGRSPLGQRFAGESRLNPPFAPDSEAPRQYEFSVALPADRSGLGLDVGLASRTTLATDSDGQIARAAAGTELRIGRGLERLVKPWQPPTWDDPTWYVFAASDGQALTWRPEDTAGLATGGMRWQDRVEVGDFQAGVSLEAGGLQASLAYVERDFSGQGASADENFAGLTVTWRR